MFNWYRNCTIQTKLILGVSVLVLIGGLGIGWMLYNLSQLSDDTADIFRHGDQALMLEELESAILKQALAEKNLLLTGDTAFVDELNQAQADAEKEVRDVDKITLLSEHKAAIQSLLELEGEYQKTVADVIQLVSENKMEEARTKSEQTANPIIDRIREEITANLAEISQIRNDSVVDAAKRARSMTVTGVVIILLFILFGSIGGFLLARSISAPLQKITGAINQIAEVELTGFSRALIRLAAGDLTVGFDVTATPIPITFTDEVGQLASTFNLMVTRLQESGGAFDKTVENLASLSRQIREGAQGLGASSTQILATVSQHTASTAEQSASITEVTATIDEVRVTAEQTAKRARDVAEQANVSMNVSQEGQQDRKSVV